MISKLLNHALTINSIHIAPKVDAVTVSVSMCDRSHVQLEKSTPRGQQFFIFWARHQKLSIIVILGTR
jgi:hypothetical protein